MDDAAAYTYQGFLVRTWEEVPGGQGGRHCSLEDPATGRRYGFDTATDVVRSLAAAPVSDAQPVAAPRAHYRPGATAAEGLPPAHSCVAYASCTTSR